MADTLATPFSAAWSEVERVAPAVTKHPRITIATTALAIAGGFGYYSRSASFILTSARQPYSITAHAAFTSADFTLIAVKHACKQHMQAQLQLATEKLAMLHAIVQCMMLKRHKLFSCCFRKYAGKLP